MTKGGVQKYLDKETFTPRFTSLAYIVSSFPPGGAVRSALLR